MKYALKMIAVVLLTFNMSGCVELMVADAVIMAAGAINDATKNKSFVSKDYKPVMSRESNDRVCKVATNEYLSPNLKKQYVKEAQRRRLNCSEDNNNRTVVASKTNSNKEYSPFMNYSNEFIMKNVRQQDRVAQGIVAPDRRKPGGKTFRDVVEGIA